MVYKIICDVFRITYSMYIAGVRNIVVQTLKIEGRETNVHSVFNGGIICALDTSHKSICWTLEEHVLSNKINTFIPVTIDLVPEVNLHAW